MVAVMVTISFSYNARAQSQDDITPKMPTAPEEKKSDTSNITKAAGPQSASDTAVEKVEVIGSRIKRITSEGPSAVKSITKEKMENSGNISVSDSLRDSNAATFGVTREASGSNAAATTNIGLRGLGATRTLVLLNGHRLPKDPSTEAVDLNLIPQSAIERIEVLKDGASALYGSDALGGVINIITKKGFTGNEVSTKYSTPEKKGGGSADVSILSGMAKENWDLVTVISFTKTDKIFGKDRDITKAGLSPTGSPGSYQDAGGVWHAASACPADLVLPEETGNGNQCFFRYNEIATVRPAITQVNLLTDFNYRLNSNLKFYNRNLVVFKDIEWSYAPGSVAVNTPAGTASVPGARRVAYRFMEAGNRDNRDTERNFSTLLGLKGNITDTWEYDISAGYNRIYRKDYAANGYLDRALVKSLISSGAFDPLAPAGSRGSISSALTDAYQTSETNLLTTDLVFTGELGQLPAGPIGAAIGANVMNEKLTQKTDDKSDAGNVIGSSGSRDSGGRDVQSAFAEISFPVTSAFEIDLAGRVDKYSDFGTTFNPKLSAKYTLSPSTLVRASVGTGFKAPTLSELYGSASEGYVTFIDRKACATNPAACLSSQHYVYETGNRDLKEEKAITGGLGLVYEPSAAFNFTADLWYTKLKNVVGIDYEALTQAELSGADLSKYGITIDRDPKTGAIDQISSKKLNLVEQEISGLDMSVDYQIANNVWGHRLELQDDVTYLLFFKKEGFPGEGKRNVLGEWGFPNWRNSLTLGLKNETSSINVTMRTIPGQKLQDRMQDAKIKMLNEFDLAGNYKFTKDSNLIAGIKNVFNSDQPVDLNGGTGGSAVVNGDLYDINGRKFFVGYSQKF